MGIEDARRRCDGFPGLLMGDGRARGEWPGVRTVTAGGHRRTTG